MNAYFYKKFSMKAFFLLLLPLLLLFGGCRKSVDYFDYVSELRSNIFLAREGDFSLRVYTTVKESPYAADGIPGECVARTEIYLLAPEGNQTVEIAFTAGKREFYGEMSYDQVKREYYYFCPADISSLSSLPCKITCGENELSLQAESVLTENTLSARESLQKLFAEEKELFSSMTDKYGFAGEIYLRLIYEDSPYYYIGVVNRKGETHAFLLNAETGKILAKRQP